MRLLGLVALSLALTTCSTSESEWVVPTSAAEPVGTQIHITGVVRHREVEGGFFVIEGTDGVSYEPTNLPAEFRKDGLAVEADARLRDDLKGVHQAGPVIELERIRAW